MTQPTTTPHQPDADERETKDEASVIVNLGQDNFIPVNINGMNATALIDTGAQVNTVSSALLEKLRNHKQITIYKSEYPAIILADGAKRATLSGKIFVTLRIRNSRFRVKLFVVESRQLLLVLGDSFLRRHQAVLNFARNIMHVKPYTKLYVAKRTVLEPFSEKCIECTVDGMLPEGTVGQVESLPTDSTISQRGIGVVPSVSKVNGEFAFIGVVNNTDAQVILKRGTKVALFACLPAGTEVRSYTLGEAIDETIPRVSSIKTTYDRDDIISEEEFLARFDLKEANLTNHQEKQLKQLLIEYKDVFSDTTGKVGHYDGDLLKVGIPKDQKPISKSPYSIHPKYEKALREELATMQKEGIIRESKSPWSAPAIVIPKPNRPGDIRLVVDYRGVNKLIEKDSHPLPRMDRCLDQIGRSRPKFMTGLDLEKGFLQMELDEESKPYTAFAVPHNLYEFNRLPMGLTTSPAQFQRCMNHTFRDLINEILVIYLDDILVYSQNFEEHLEALRRVFTRLREANLKLRAGKTQLARNELKFLGFRVTSEGLKTDARICDDVRDFPQPKSVKEIRSFLGLAQFYRKFIRDYSKLAKPLNDLLKKDHKFVWTDKCEESFKIIKDALTNPPILAHPNLDKPFKLYTDASDFSVGYVLCQEDTSTGTEKVIAYGGKSLQKYQLSYGVTEKEMLAAYSGVIHFDHYLRHNQFELITDHSALESLLTKQKELKGKFARWAAELLNYSFTVKHRPGKQLGNADAMSRRFYDTTVDCNPCVPAAPTVRAMTRSQDKQTAAKRKADTDSTIDHIRECMVDSNYTAADIREAQRNDPDLAVLTNYLLKGKLPDNDEEARNVILHAPEYFLNEDMILFHEGVADGSNKKYTVRYNQLVMPKEHQEKILREYHDSVLGGHFGIEKTLKSILTKYYWHTITRDVAEYVRTCHDCQTHKRDTNQRRPILGTTPEPETLELVTIDIMGPLKETPSNMKHILVITDYATRYSVLRPLPDTSAATVGRVFFDEWICKLGAPIALSSDRGPAFVSEIMREICRIYGIEQKFSCPYVPRSHGIVERLQETVQQVLSFYLDRYEDEWDRALQGVASCINSVPSSSTAHSPNFLMFGREPRKTVDTVLKPPPKARRSIREYLETFISDLETSREIAQEVSQKKRIQYAKSFNKRAQAVDFKVGDLVFVYIPKNRKGFSKSLSHNWHGPYVVVKAEGQLHYKLRDYSTNNLVSIPVHAQRLKHGRIREEVERGEIPKMVCNTEHPIKGLTESDLPSTSFTQTPGNSIGEAVITPDANPDDTVIADIACLWEDPMVYEVERILQGRYKTNGDEEFLVKWRGYPSTQNTYVSRNDLNEACLEYVRAHPVRMIGRPCGRNKMKGRLR